MPEFFRSAFGTSAQQWIVPIVLFGCVLSSLAETSIAQEANAAKTKRTNYFDSQSAHHNPPDLSVVSKHQWNAVDRSVDRALDYLHSRQQSDGSIPTMEVAKPAVTALYVMAALSAGHEPGD